MSVRKQTFTYLRSDDRQFRLVKAFRCLVPVSTDALACQFNFLLVFANDFAEAEVSDLDFTIVEDYVLGFEVVVDDFLFLVVQVLQSAQDLADDQLRFFFLDLLVFFQVIVQVWATAELENGAEAVVVDFNSVKVFHDASMVQLFMDLVLAQSMLDVVVFYLITPAVVEVVDFACHFTELLKVKGLVDLRETSFAEDRQNQVPVVEDCKRLASVDAAVLGLLFVADAFELEQVLALLLVQHVELLAYSALFVLKEFDFELINLLLFVLVNVLELRLFKGKLAVVIGLAEGIRRDWWQSLARLRDALLL